jgi:hypothetical protein
VILLKRRRDANTENGQMNTQDKEHARSLAIRYQAYLAACNERDREGQLVWGRMLMNAQRATDIWLIDEHELRATIDWLNEQRAA